MNILQMHEFNGMYNTMYDEAKLSQWKYENDDYMFLSSAFLYYDYHSVLCNDSVLSPAVPIPTAK